MRSSSPPLIVLAALLPALVLCACRAPAPPPDAARTARATRPELLALRADWGTCDALSFERAVDALPPDGGLLDERDLAHLGAALGRSDPVALRAAILLGRSADPRAGRALLARLEARDYDRERHADAADVVAAASLAGWAFAPDVPARLAALAVGARPHEDIEVRVECAASALAFGRDEVAPFLLRVLRSQTPAELEDPPDWETKRTMAWSKARAALALSARAGVPCSFDPDASYADQRAETERLARLLGPGAGS